MREIDFIYKNFDIDIFLRNLKKDKYSKEADCIRSAILDSFIDIESIKAELSFYKYAKGKNIKNSFIDFLKKNKNGYTDNDIEKYFIKKRNIIHVGHEEGVFEFLDLMTTLINTGEFFRKLRKFFKITFYAQIRNKPEKEYLEDGVSGLWEDAYCLYSFKDKTYRLIVFFFEDDGNDNEYIYKTFKNKPSNTELLEILKKKGMSYTAKSELIIRETSQFQFTTWWKNQHRKGFKVEHPKRYIFKNEDDFLKHYYDHDIVANYLDINPQKYYPKIKPSFSLLTRLIKNYWENNPNKKIKDHKLFLYCMSNKLKWRDSKKFINDIMYSCYDIDGFLQFIPNKLKNNKEFAEEIRVLKIFRYSSKKQIIKAFKSNKDKLEALMKYYMPSTILNDPHLMMSLLKINLNLMADIGQKLKNNKKFMAKVDKLVKSK